MVTATSHDGETPVKPVTQLAAIVALALFAATLVVEAQPKVHRVGVLTPGPASRSPGFDAFVQGLRDLGYVEGRNIIIEYRSADDKLERLPALAAELVRINVDVIVAVPTPAVQAAKNATTTIPIVFSGVSDPVNFGLVASLARPGGNLTGQTNTAPDVSGKRLQLLKEIVPRASRVAVLWNAANPIIARQVRETEVAAHALGTELSLAEIRGADDLESAFRTITAGRVDGLVVLADFLTMEHQGRITTLAAKHRLPTISEFREFAASGGLMAYGPSIPAAARRTAAYVDKILKGAKPGELPVEQPTKFDLVINLKTARMLGVTIPQSILLRADQVLE